ncbi:hypothetical protein QQF64_029859 [Cirrhinus molitorella]|uniref:Uncharacterized protein n=1 Tax=Cirrhinus molitorella TaxID=172907 RepID=A0ABR3N1Q0_9TELE
MLERFYKLREEVKHFMEIKGKPVVELSDDKWLCDLAFKVDITKHLSELNIKLQVPDNLQHKIIELQTDDELKAKYNLPLLEFYKLYVQSEDFPILRRHALKFASLFGMTYCCE